MKFQIFELSLCLVLIYLACESTAMSNNAEHSGNWREARKINFLKDMFAKTKAGPLYLINGTLCRFVNNAPICTTLSTNGFFRNSTNNQQPSFPPNNQQFAPNNVPPVNNQNQFANNQFQPNNQQPNQGFQPNQQQPQQVQQPQQQQQPNFG